MTGVIHTLIVGAGPAGLAAAAACEATGTSFNVAELGPALPSRGRLDAHTVTQGVGGAGLYSDGKFSFHPSATALWKLRDGESLREAYDWFRGMMSKHGISAPDFPTETIAPTQLDQVSRKHYRSDYMPLPNRLAWIDSLASKAGNCLLTGFRVGKCVFVDGAWTCELSSGADGRTHVRARSVVFAGGRFGPLGFSDRFPGVATKFRHVEIGIRIEQPAGEFFLSQENQLDPKLCVEDVAKGMAARTFCCCRDGEVVTTCTSGIWCVSGRADGPRTGRSNVGLNVRITDPDAARVFSWLMPKLTQRPMSPLTENFDTVLSAFENQARSSRIVEFFGREISSAIVHAAKKLETRFPLLRRTHDMVAWAPTVEGVGAYPVLDADLRALPGPLWVAGDSSGIFRGLTAAIVSGYYAGLQASRLGGP